MSSDPYSGSYDFTNPQSLNRYAYVQGNPLGAIDPLGLADISQAQLRQMMLESWYYNQSQFSLGSNWDEFSIYDTVVGAAGAYTYSGDVWDAMMQDGYGGGVANGPDDSLLCGGVVCGYTWSFLAGMTMPTSQMLPGNVTIPVEAPNNGFNNNKQIQNCLNNYYNSTPGKIVSFLSLMSAVPGVGPEWKTSLAEDVGETGSKVLVYKFLRGASQSMARTPFGSMSGAVADGIEAAAEGIAVPAVAAATVTDILVHNTCAASAYPTPSFPSPF